MCNMKYFCDIQYGRSFYLDFNTNLFPISRVILVCTSCFRICISKVIYMSFDRFLLAVESRDLSQADKSIIRVPSFSMLQNFNFRMIKFTVIPKKLFDTWQYGKIDVLVKSYHSKICKMEK